MRTKVLGTMTIGPDGFKGLGDFLGSYLEKLSPNLKELVSGYDEHMQAFQYLYEKIREAGEARGHGVGDDIPEDTDITVNARKVNVAKNVLKEKIEAVSESIMERITLKLERQGLLEEFIKDMKARASEAGHSVPEREAVTMDEEETDALLSEILNHIAREVAKKERKQGPTIVVSAGTKEVS
jgi:hypothetical protein